MKFPIRLRCAVLANGFICALLSCAAQASVVVLDTVSGNPATPGDSLTSTSAPFGLIRIGAGDVQIDHFGIFGRLLPNGTAATADVRWDIFTATGIRIYDSGSQAVSGTGVSTWYDASVFAAPLTLAAGTDYYIGLITDANFLLRRFSQGAVDIQGNGLVSPGGNFPGSNGVVTNFADPVLTRTDLTVQVGERVFAPDGTVLPKPIPLPAAAWLFGSGLLIMGAGPWRRRRVGVCAAKIARGEATGLTGPCRWQRGMPARCVAAAAIEPSN